MTFSYPLAFVLALGVLLIIFLRKAPRSTIRHPRVAFLKTLNPGLRARVRRAFLGALGVVFLTVLSLGAARPHRVTPIEREREARNIMLTVDLSRSMGFQDFPTSQGDIARIDGLKSVTNEFIDARKEDRIGLVVFGTKAYLQAPLTRDHDLVRQMVERLRVGSAGDSTSIGDGLGVSLKRITEVPAKTKAIILVTDGANNSGSVNPLKAAQVAKDLGVKIHTIGIGSVDPSRLGPMGIPMGEPEFDEAALKEIASTTGGVYFNAQNLDGLKNIYHEIDSLEKSSDETPEQESIEELFMPLAWASVVLFLLYATLANTVFQKVSAV